MGRRIKWLILVMGMLFVCISDAYGQINTDWIGGEKQKKARVDNESKPLQLMFGIGVGTAKWTYESRDFTTGDWIAADENTDAIYDLAAGINYRVFRTGGKGAPQVEMSVFGSVGLAPQDFDGFDFVLLGTVGPELGVRLPVSSSFIIRPLVSIGPGLSIYVGHTYGDRTNLVWIPGAAIELQFGNNPFSLVVGGKMIMHGEEQYREQYLNDFKSSRKDILGSLVFRIKM